MRILLIGPHHDGGSIPPYLDVLAGALHGYGVRVDRLGSRGVPYDAEAGSFWDVDRVLRAAEDLLQEVDLGSYDLLSVHFGNLEVEQLLPVLWKRRRRPPAVYHVHSLDWTLFTAHVVDLPLYRALTQPIGDMAAFVYFGTFARSAFTRRFNLDVPTTVAWLPTTIPTGAPRPRPLTAPSPDHPAARPSGSLYGYAAPWKDIPGLLTACAATRNPSRITVAGPLWDAPREAGADLTGEAMHGCRHGAVEFTMSAGYLDACQRMALIRATDFGVFPYRHHRSFQGSGAIADYLGHGVPVLATDVANMAELVGDAGIIVPPDDTDALAAALDVMADSTHRRPLREAAQRRSSHFSAEHHAARCLRLYDTVLGR